MFKTRLISGVVILGLAILFMVLGGLPLYIFVFAISMIGLYEFYHANHIQDKLTGILGYIGGAVYLLMLRTSYDNAPLMGIALATLLIMAGYVITFPKQKMNEVMYAIAGISYVCVLMSFIYLVRIRPTGLALVPLIFVSAWGNDTCAYCVGMLIGKKKIFPELSPKKSLEGLIGGIVGAAVLGLLYGLLFGSDLTEFSNPLIACTVIGGVGAVPAIIGDLAASAVKRNTGIKDYGNLIPGHGGIMDRFDSILFPAPAVYILAVLFGA